MNKRTLALSPRIEDVREKQQPVPVVSFSLQEIKAHFDSSIASIRRQFDVARQLKEAGFEDDQKNIFRSQIVFLESALDFYLHELNKYGLMQIFNSAWDKTEPYKNLKIPMRHLEEGLKAPETSGWFLEFISEAYSRDVFTSFEYMKDQMNMLGLKFSDLLNQAFPPSSDPTIPSKTGKQIIRDLYDRRNQIAHQTDRSHANATQNDITENYVLSCISDVEILVTHLHTAAINKGQS